MLYPAELLSRGADCGIRTHVKRLGRLTHNHSAKSALILVQGFSLAPEPPGQQSRSATLRWSPLVGPLYCLSYADLSAARQFATLDLSHSLMVAGTDPRLAWLVIVTPGPTGVKPVLGCRTAFVPPHLLPNLARLSHRIYHHVSVRGLNPRSLDSARVLSWMNAGVMVEGAGSCAWALVAFSAPQFLCGAASP